MSYAFLVPPPYKGPRIPYKQLVERARQSLPSSFPTSPEQVTLALDVDGTLIRADGASLRVRRSLSKALQVGINVVIATGRGRFSTSPVFAELGLPGGLSVSANGAQTFMWHGNGKHEHTPQLLREVRFDPSEAAHTVLEAIPNALVGVDGGDDGLMVSGLFPSGELLAFQKVTPLDELLRFQTPRLIIRAPEMDRDDFAAVLDQLPLKDVEYSVGWTSWVDISPPGVTKASGLEALMGDLGVTKGGTVAIGDGTNDIGMLKWAAHGVAMGGATEEVRAVADAVTGPVDHDGAAAVIDALVERY